MVAPEAKHCPAGMFLRSWLIGVIPIGLLIAPLFLHRSGEPQIGPYSVNYAMLLVAICGLTLLLTAGAAWRSNVTGSFRPAFVLLTAIGSVVLTAAAVEVFLCFTANDVFAEYRKIGQRKAALVGYESAPNNSWQLAGGTHTTDERGLRTHVSDPDWIESPGTRIFTLGGSSVFGFGLNDDETWSHLLEQRLREVSGGSSLNVINAGNNGHNSIQLLLRFFLKVVPLEPDYLLYYQAPNDVGVVVFEPTTIWIEDEVLFSETLRSYLTKTKRDKNWYARTLLGYRLQRWMEGGERTREPVPSSSVSDELTADLRLALEANGQRYLRNVTALADVCKRNNVRLVLITFVQDDENVNPFSRHAIFHYNDLLRQLSNEEGIPLIDLAPAFASVEDKSALFLEDHYHPSKVGSEWIAEHVAVGMADLLAGIPADTEPRGIPWAAVAHPVSP